MPVKRIIPRLDFVGGRIVKSDRFVEFTVPQAKTDSTKNGIEIRTPSARLTFPSRKESPYEGT